MKHPRRDYKIYCQCCHKILIEVKFDWWYGTQIDYNEYDKVMTALRYLGTPPMCEDCNAIYKRICREAWPL